MVGPGVVPHQSEINALPEGAGVKHPLAHKMKFQQLPHHSPIPDKRTAPVRGRSGSKSGGHSQKPKNLLTSPVRCLRQAAREHAESYFHIAGVHHANAAGRRRKTEAELLEGAEYYELHDRRFPGRLAARGRP